MQLCDKKKLYLAIRIHKSSILSVTTFALLPRITVIREVQKRLGVWSGEVRDYSDSGLPAPGDGDSVIKLLHRGHRRTHEHPVDCDQCGRDVAAKLRKLDVGAEGECIR